MHDDECREIVDTDETFRIQSNGVCTRCGLISIPEIHVLSCTVCHETSAHSLCMKPHLRKKWSCPGCFSGGQRRAKAASNNPALHIIQPLANPLPESSVVLCDNCEGEFSMTHLKMSSLPKGDWFCQHCDASAAVADDNVSAPPTTSSSTRRATAGMSTATAPSRTTPLRSASKRGRVDAAPPPVDKKRSKVDRKSSSTSKTSSRRTRGEPTCVRCDKVPGIESSCKECRRVATGQHKAPKRTRLPLRVVVPEPVAVASDTSTVADTAAVDLWTMHEMVGRTVLVYMAASSGQWLSGRVGFFDPHTLLHRVQFLDDTDQWLPLHEMPYCYSQHVNVFVKLDQPNAWWPAQLMSTNDVAARHMQPTDKTLVYLYGGDNVCAWVSMSSVRCFDVFEADACDPSNASWADAVDDAKEEMHLARETVVDAKETLRRDIQKRLHGKTWIGKHVEVMNFSQQTDGLTHGTITQFNPVTHEYFVSCTDEGSSSRWFAVNDDVHISLLVDCTYAELSMQWYADPHAVLREDDTHQLLAKTATSVEPDVTRCVKCLFPLAGEAALLPCASCAQLFHRSCVDCPQHEFPLVDPVDGAILVDDINPPFVCPSCLVCDGCTSPTTTDTWHRWKLPLTPVTLCTTCHDLYKTQSFCPVCHRVYGGGAMPFCADVMQCTTCDLWVHSECEPDSDPMYHTEDYPPPLAFHQVDDSATKSHPSEPPDSTAPTPDTDEVLTEKQRRRAADDKIARTLAFASTYDPRILAKYECYTCRRIRCFRLLKALVAEDKLGLFREPVTVAIAPTYFDVIKHPMDLQTMENNLKDQHYVHALCADFRDDFELMCLNAVTFNSKERNFTIWREAWRFFNAGTRLVRQTMPSVGFVPGKFADNMIAAAKRQLPNNSVLANKEEPKKDVVVVISDECTVESSQTHATDAAATPADTIKVEPGMAPPSSTSSAVVVVADKVVQASLVNEMSTFVVPTELAVVPKPYSCVSSVVATQSKIQAHEMAWVDVCAVCCSSGQTLAMVFCVDCGEGFHTFCLQPALDLEAKRSDKILEYWRCPNCKICEFCGRCHQEDEAKLLVCDVCERGFHTFCLKPKLRDVPSGGFVCGSCIQCDSCSVPQDKTTWSSTPSSCLTCLGVKIDDLAKKKPSAKRSTDCCPVCSKKWMATEPLIQCDGCELWVHPVCDHITDDALAVLVDDSTSEYYCPVCRQKQRQHLNVFKKAWDLQMNIALIQNKRQDLVETWQAKQVNAKTTRQWAHWRARCPCSFLRHIRHFKPYIICLSVIDTTIMYRVCLGEECLKSLAGRRLSFSYPSSTQGDLFNVSLIPVSIRHRASRYLRFKRYARGPKAALRRQNRKKGHFFTWEGVNSGDEGAIANVVTEAVSAAAFLACCTWLYGTKKLSMFTATLVRASGDPIPDALWNALVDKHAISLADEVKFLTAEYTKRSKARDPVGTVLLPEHPPPVVRMTVAKPLHGWQGWADHTLHFGSFQDHRMCGLCRVFGDSAVCGRLVFADYDQWVHVNCAFWSHEVYEDAYGTLIMCQKARFRGRTTRCSVCHLSGATLGCHGLRCQLNFHFTCAQTHVNFTLDKQTFCHQHDHWMVHIKKQQDRRRKKLDDAKAKLAATAAANIDGKLARPNDEDGGDNDAVEVVRAGINDPRAIDDDNEVDEAVHLCVSELVDSICTDAIDARLEPLRFVMSDPLTDKKATKTQMTKGTCYRVGALCVQNLGTIQVGNDSFHTRSTLYPLGYRSTRLFWSATNVEQRALYECEIVNDNSHNNNMATTTSRPLFKITPCDDMDNPIYGATPNDAIHQLRSRLVGLYESHRAFAGSTNPFTNRTSWYSYGLLGDHFFGLTVPVIGAALETLPYAATTALQDAQNPYPYAFCHTLPTPAMFEDAKHDLKRHRVANAHAQHSSGCARTDGFAWHKLKTKPDGVAKRRKVNVSKQASNDDTNQTKQPANGGMENLPIPMQYRDLRRRPFSERLEVRKSKIHGYGLFVKEAIAEGKMIVEYQGQAIRQKVADMREKRYEEMGIGSCYMFRLDKDIIVDATQTGNLARFINHSCDKIIIFAKVSLQPGDEVTYDYKFPIEDEALRCDCGAPNCIGRMN
ncbi:hypothetical protein DYB36_000729 [Aphanomyces astaci]|uniref:Histone-lysine N-methyltransferase n=1 Tax=Aphanomyces astaci TaxID=112090 RepID=A0A397B576_APHAT|nr:hypothetical protein DYB36_000729 [Aphanomyces astaci]